MCRTDSLWRQLEILSSARHLLIGGKAVSLIQTESKSKACNQGESELHIDLEGILGQLLTSAQRLINNRNGEPECYSSATELEPEESAHVAAPAAPATPAKAAGPASMPKATQRIFRKVALQENLLVPPLRGSLTPASLTYEDTAVRVARKPVP